MAKQSKSSIKIVLIFFIVLITSDVLINPSEVFDNILSSLKLWLFKVYPPIFLFYILSSLIINLNFIKSKSKILLQLFKFKYSRSYSIFTISLLIGNPATSALILESIQTQNIDTEDGNHLLCISSFLNPLFIISFVSSHFIYFRYSILIILIHLMSNFIIGFFLSFNKKTRVIINNPPQHDNNVIKEFFDSIERANSLLLKVCGIMVMCNLCKHSIVNLLNYLDIKGNFITIFLSMLEVASGLNDIVNLPFSQNIVLCLIAFLVSFGGFSIHLQVYAIISGSNLKFKKFLYFRLIQGFLSFLMCFMILYNNLSSFQLILFLIIIVVVLIGLFKILNNTKIKKLLK